jgi:hypothetical protein
MYNLLIIFILFLIIKNLYNFTIVKHLNDGYYLYYEYKEFDMWYKKFNIRVDKICLWKFKRKDYEQDIY